MGGTWPRLIARMQTSIVSDKGPSQWATYTSVQGVRQRVKGVFESPFKKQTPQDQEVQVFVVSQEPRFGVRISDFGKTVVLSQNATLVLEDDPGCKYKVMRIEDTTQGWVDLVLEKISG